MDKQQKDKEDKENIIKMIRDLKARGVHNSVAVIEKYHYITLAKQDKPLLVEMSRNYIKPNVLGAPTNTTVPGCFDA